MTEEEARKDNAILRRLLWIRHGCPSSALYGDDGELQCSKCMIDFKRYSAQQIENTFIKIGWEKLLKRKK